MGKDKKVSVRERKAAARKREDFNKKLKIAAIIAIPVLVIALIVVVAVIGKNASTINVDYSAGLDENGLIEGVKVDDYVELCDYSNIVIQLPEVAMSDEDWKTHVDGLLEQNKIEELTDEFIKENFNFATTVEEYEAYIRNLAKEENTKTYVLEYLLENCKVNSIPKDYLKLLKENWDAQYQAEYSYYNNMYYQFLGYYNWNSCYDYYGVSRSEYKEMVNTSAEDSAKQNIILQAIYEDLGLTITQDDIDKALVEAGYESDDMESAIEDYGKPYWNQFAIFYKVVEAVTAKATVQE